jgi:hypothetical protein
VSQGDPTDNALAAIASILDHPDAYREPVRPVATEKSPAVPPPLPSFEDAYTLVNEPAHVEVTAPTEAAPAIEVEQPVEFHAPIEAHGYSRVGPGPMASIRFRWTVRAEKGEYYVDETIGEDSFPVVAGPMKRDEAVQLVHDREAEAKRRFEQLKNEMSGYGSVVDLQRNDTSEA